MQNSIPTLDIKAIIGLGNPGPKYYHTRHSIGFQVLDALSNEFNGTWQTKGESEVCEIFINFKKIILVKPMTYMNSSGKAMPWLQKQGIKQENVLVVHDELELPFGALKLKFNGSARGHNGLKSIIAHGGANFLRLRFGVDRPDDRARVPDYVLEKFKEPQIEIDIKVGEACDIITDYIKKEAV